MDETPATNLVLGLRAAVFVSVAAFVALGPAYRQVWGGSSELVRAWRMFRGNAVGVCDVRYVADGAPVDRFALLGHPSWSAAPLEVRRVMVKSLPATNRSLCEALGPGTDLRLTARCATQDGWVTRSAGADNVCRR